MAWLLTSGSCRMPPSLALPSPWLHAASSPPPVTSPAARALTPLPDGLLVVLVQLLSSTDVQPLLGTEDQSGTGALGGNCRRSVEPSGSGVLAAQCSPSAPVDTLCLLTGWLDHACVWNANPDAEVVRPLAEWACLLKLVPRVLAP